MSSRNKGNTHVKPHTWPDSSPQQRSGARTSACAGCKYLLGLHMGPVPDLADLGQENNAKTIHKAG